MSELEKLAELIEWFRRVGHDYVDEDGWYSCPSHPEYLGNEPRDYCNCGLAEHNAKVDEALQIVRGLIMREGNKP